MSSSPAISRSRVDFPQPDGPTNTTKDLSAISRLTPLMISADPNDLRTPSRTMLPMALPLFDRPEGEAANQLSLAEPAEHQDGRYGQRRGRRQLGPEQSLGARI